MSLSGHVDRATQRVILEARVLTPNMSVGSAPQGILLREMGMPK